VTGLPFVDEHRLLIVAEPDVVWRSLAAHVATPEPALLHAVLGTEPRRASGREGLLGAGARVPGFAVAEVELERRVRLAGRHRFSRYALTFTLTAQPGGTVLTARTEAAFPGPHGRAYRLLVIGSGAHRVAVGRILRDVRRRALAARGDG
jgi:hypothetical protein